MGDALPRINQPRLIICPPTKIPHPLHIRGLLIKLPHSINSQTFKSFTVSASVGKEIEHGEHGGKTRRTTNCIYEVRSETGAAVGCGNSGNRENAKGAIFEVRGKVAAVQAAHAVTDKMNTSARVVLFDGLQQYHGSVSRTACCRDARYENLAAVGF
jgi:hypothetical protein